MANITTALKLKKTTTKIKVRLSLYRASTGPRVPGV
jgi:hypothetical protein